MGYHYAFSAYIHNEYYSEIIDITSRNFNF